MTTTAEKLALMKTFAIGEKAWWVSPTGYKERVTVSGCIEQGFQRLKVQSMYGLMMDFVVQDGRMVGLEVWGHLEKMEVPPVTKNLSIVDKIRNFFK